MKTKLIAIICAVLLVFGTLAAQTNQPPTPNDYKKWAVPIKGYSDSTTVPFYTGRVDTLAFTYHATAKYVLTYFPYAATPYLSFTIGVTDTANIAVLVRSRVRSMGTGYAAGAFSTILTDSLVNSGASASSGISKEFSLKDLDSDLFDGLDQEFFIILTHSAWGDNDTQGTARRKVTFNSRQ